ncbi:MAG: nicotinate phosphoribosyltransferase [Deltaproteobacteria bacterium]|nr:nicotinate phosphoribosyltransferase [Deltaproteobacteria bacterium]
MNRKDSKISEGILFTDQYQLTMAQLYFVMGIHEKKSQFDHFFRNYPDYGSHQAGYCINAGLQWAVEWMMDSRFGEKEIDYLREQTGQTGERVFRDDFLNWLSEYGNFEGVTMLAIPEGRVVHPNVPLTVIEGPLAMAQILESPLLNKLNYQTLIATKAARIKDTAHGQPLLEFGLRRGHDTGVNAGVRAALIGGADFSSNVGISHSLGYPPKGTHGHSMVQVFIAMGEGELGAFRAYAELYPDDCLLLVDTINTLGSGIPNAIVVFEELRRKGHEPLGIRLDSGDLAYLSIQAAAMLDKAGFPNTNIVLSNQIDELVVWQIITQIEEEASRFGVDPDHLIKRLVYGVGTNLITSKGAPALDGVYKLVAVNEGQDWVASLKLSESREKTHNPGSKRVWRLYDKRGKATADLLTLGEMNPADMDEITLHHALDHTKHRVLKREEISKAEPLLEKILDQGRLVYNFPSIENIRSQREKDMDCLDTGIKRIVNPHIYHVSLSQELWNLKQGLIDSVE